MEESRIAKHHTILAAYLGKTRNHAGLTVPQVAKRMGTTELSVKDWESGRRRMDIVELRAYCAALGISLFEFVEGLEATLQNSGTDS